MISFRSVMSSVETTKGDLSSHISLSQLIFSKYEFLWKSTTVRSKLWPISVVWVREIWREMERSAISQQSTQSSKLGQARSDIAIMTLSELHWSNVTQPTLWIVDFLFTVSSPVTIFTDTVISVYSIHTLSIDTGTCAALIDIDVAMRSCESGFAIAVVKTVAWLTVDKMRAICCAHSQSWNQAEGIRGRNLGRLCQGSAKVERKLEVKYIYYAIHLRWVGAQSMIFSTSVGY